MAVVTVSGNPVVGAKYTVTTASSADWASVSNSTYFFDLTDQLVYYKNSSGTVVNPFAPPASGITSLTTTGTSGVSTLVGSTLNIPNYTFTDTNIYNTNGTLTSSRTATLGNFSLIFSGIGTGGGTTFSRTNGGGTTTSFSLSYNSAQFSTFDGNQGAQFSCTPSQNIGSAYDTTGLSTNIQQVPNLISLVVNDVDGELSRLDVNSAGAVSNKFTGYNGFGFTFGLGGSLVSASTTGSAKTWTLPNTTGTIALTSDIPSTNYGAIYSQATFTYLT